MQKLRWNRDLARSVAQKLLDSKRQELKDGVPRKDIMSLLGLLLHLLCFVQVVVEELPNAVNASDSQRQDWRLADEEIIPQVR